MGVSAMIRRLLRLDRIEEPDGIARIRRELRDLAKGKRPEHWPTKVWQPFIESVPRAELARDPFIMRRPTFGQRLLHPQELATLRGNKWNGTGLDYYAARLSSECCSPPLDAEARTRRASAS